MVNANSAYYPELWAKFTIPLLKQYRVMTRVIALDLNMKELASYGDTVNSRVRYPLTAVDKALGSDYSFQDIKARKVHERTTAKKKMLSIFVIANLIADF